MARILFTHSYFYRFDQKQWKTRQPYPPLATMIAAALMRKDGHQVSLWDTNLRKDPLEIVPRLQQEKPDYLVIYDDSFNYLSKMCLTNMRAAAFVMAREAKEAGCRVIVASSDASDHYGRYLKNGADAVIRGEGEQTLQELIAAFEQGSDLRRVRGIALASESGAEVTPPRPLMQSLDSLPLPAWDLIEMNAYEKIWRKYHGYFSLNVATTRGCPFKCNWCAKPIYGNRYTSRSPAHVVEEIALLLDRYRPDHIWFCDDIFGLKPGWVQEFSALVKSRNLRFRFKIQSRADLLLQESTAQALADAGAETVWMGAESGSQKILDAMDKGITTAQIREATECLKAKNIRVAYFIQFGYPGENQEDIDKTIELITSVMPEEIGISVSYPLPGTKFYDQVKDKMMEKRNWTESDDLALMFAGTYHEDYYRRLHEYVHGVYRTQRGKIMLSAWVKRPWRLKSREMVKLLGAIYFAFRSYVLRKKLSKLMVPSTGLGGGKD